MNLQVIKFAIKNYYNIIDKLLLKRIDVISILHSLHPKSSNVKKQKNQ